MEEGSLFFLPLNLFNIVMPLSITGDDAVFYFFFCNLEICLWIERF